MKIGASTKTLLTAFIALAVLLTVFFPARAQEEIVLENLLVDIWPEYDKPAVLVIYHITLSASTSLPAQMSIRLPTAAGTPHAVAMQDPNGLYTINYDTTPAGEWQEISFSTPVPDVRIEFYDPGLAKDGQERTFIFRWPGDYTVNNLSLQVQQPPTASGMVFKPALGSGLIADDGLTYYTYMAGKVNAGTTFDLSISYTKPNDDLTASTQFQPVQPEQAVTDTTAGRFNPNLILPWALGGIGVLLIAGGLLWYYRGVRAQPAAASRRRHTGRAGQTSDEAPTGGVFCHQCGKKAASGDVFCRSCGTKLR